VKKTALKNGGKIDHEKDKLIQLPFFFKYADGVLSDDGDVFLYGAKVVYKDFNISTSSKV
jgi:hypothetical protein